MINEFHEVNKFKYSVGTGESSGKYLILENYDGTEKHLTIPSSVKFEISDKIYPVTKIGEEAFVIFNDDFSGNEYVTSITIPSSITEIGVRAFENCYNLTSVTIPDSVTEIGRAAFQCCKSLETITIPDSVTKIGWNAFGGCDNLKEIILPQSWADKSFDDLIKIGIDPFEKTVYIGDKEHKYTKFFVTNRLKCVLTDDGVRIHKYVGNKKQLTITPTMTKDDNDYSVTEIGEKAFCDCKSLTSVTIPDSVIYIGKESFSLCTSLRSVVLSNSIIQISFRTFHGCKSLENIIIPNSVTEIERDAFYNCKNLKEIRLPKSWENKSKKELNQDLEKIGIYPSQLKTINFGSQEQNENLSIRDVRVDKPVIGACNLTGVSKPKAPAGTNGRK